jgi:hypothetical protein
LSGGDPTTVHATFVFADIAGFTASPSPRRPRCRRRLADFCRAVRAELPASGRSEVKRIATP